MKSDRAVELIVTMLCLHSELSDIQAASYGCMLRG